MKIRWIIPAVAAAPALLLAGCGAPETEPAPSVSVAPAATATPTPTPTRNENDRGQLIKEIGEVATYQDEENAAPTMKFKVTSAEIIECDNPYAGEPNGYPLAVSLEIETTKDFVGPLILNGSEAGMDFSSHFWSGYSNNGTRMNTLESTAASNCLQDRTELLPDWVSKGEKLNGMVILDVASKEGEIAFDPANFGGWVWEFPSK